MIESFIQGVVLGFGVSVPFGPINILILSAALKSFKNALAIGFGVMSADFLYLVLLSFGALAFLQNETLEQGFAIFGFCFLSYVAFLMIRKKPKDLNLDKESKQESALKSFFKGFLLNLTNPFVVGFWLSMSVLVASDEFAYFMFAGLVCAILIWVFSLSFIAAKLKGFVTPKILFFINLASALIIEYFAINLLVKTFWS